MGEVGAVIVAAGASKRMGGVDKVFAMIAGKPLLVHTIEAFVACASVDRVVVVLSEDRLDAGRRLVRDGHWREMVDVCAGGAHRQDSVRNGLGRLTGCEWVIIHDGARPCVTLGLIEAGLQEAREWGAAVPVVPVNDTIKVLSPGLFVEHTPARENLWAAQTPQVFRFDIIMQAHQEARGYATDDAALVEKIGYRVKAFLGSDDNIKVTTPVDLLVAEAVLGSRQ